MLLYLEIEKMAELSEILRRLECHVLRSNMADSELDHIKKNLSDLVNPLSPLSRTKKLAREILNLTGEYALSDRTAIIELISDVRDIYKISHADSLFYFDWPVAAGA